MQLHRSRPEPRLSTFERCWLGGATGLAQRTGDTRDLFALRSPGSVSPLCPTCAPVKANGAARKARERDKRATVVRAVKLKARQLADELGIIADSGNGSRDVRERSMRKRFRKLGANGRLTRPPIFLSPSDDGESPSRPFHVSQLAVWIIVCLALTVAVFFPHIVAAISKSL
jgi:hypothetical protein